MKPEDFWRIEPPYQEQYDKYVAIGRESAARSSVCFLAIARDAMPFLENTLVLLEETAGFFKSASLYVYENDSTDGTTQMLTSFAESRPWATHEHATLHRPDYRGFEEDRTIALAEYRNRCRRWAVQSARDCDFVLVIDMDPMGGFSPEGVLNSIGWLDAYGTEQCRSLRPGGMASVSLWASTHADQEGAIRVMQYDAWAARLNWWEDRRQHGWFHELLPPVGSEPIPINSAFGGLAVYRSQAFFADGVEYVGGDCEHVALHKTMRQAGYQMYLNPGCRYAAVIPHGVAAQD